MTWSVSRAAASTACRSWLIARLWSNRSPVFTVMRSPIVIASLTNADAVTSAQIPTAHGGPHAVATLASRQLRLDEEQRALQIRKIAGVQNLDPGIVLPVEGVVSAGQPAFFASLDELNQRPR